MKTPPTDRPVTIKDIARKFKCSPSTVSRALNNHPLINEDTRKNLQEYAQKVGYQRNSVSLSLLNKRTGTLGVIVPTLNHQHETAIIDGLQSMLQPQGYLMNICVTNESYLLEKEYVEKLLANRVEGIFLSISQETYDSGHYEHLESIIQRKVPLIFIDREYGGFEASRVTIDDYYGAFAATEHLIKMGCQRIAHLKGPQGLAVTEQRFNGYLDCLKKYQLPINEDLIANTNFKVDSAVIPTQRFMELPSPPDGIFGVNDQVAIGAMYVVREQGFEVPRQVAIVGFDDSPISAYISPPLSTVRRPGKQIGAEASRIFLGEIKDRTLAFENLILPSSLIIRESSLRA
ncbi:LacI family DNA-binding transcriptional regulator [Runella zeae]|uniref:LacI family DNA-binding transcriptional regulator n=1 Tax=Runella zeae TaxID=94255 RepID=UPI000429BD84|nr:LacI family DNA-binding transcriptional regulator [Runella zeae]